MDTLQPKRAERINAAIRAWAMQTGESLKETRKRMDEILKLGETKKQNLDIMATVPYIQNCGFFDAIEDLYESLKFTKEEESKFDKLNNLQKQEIEVNKMLRSKGISKKIVTTNIGEELFIKRIGLEKLEGDYLLFFCTFFDTKMHVVPVRNGEVIGKHRFYFAISKNQLMARIALWKIETIENDRKENK